MSACLLHLSQPHRATYQLFMFFCFSGLQDFLKQEFSEENILFWIACEKLSTVTDKTEVSNVLTT